MLLTVTEKKWYTHLLKILSKFLSIKENQENWLIFVDLFGQGVIDNPKIDTHQIDIIALAWSSNSKKLSVIAKKKLYLISMMFKRKSFMQATKLILKYIASFGQQLWLPHQAILWDNYGNRGWEYSFKTQKKLTSVYDFFLLSQNSNLKVLISTMKYMLLMILLFFFRKVKW